MKKIDKLIYFIKDGLAVGRQLIDDYIIESNTPNQLILAGELPNRGISIISDKLNIPESYDKCFIIERPHDKEELRELRLSCVFRPLFDSSYDGMKEVTVDPELDVYYKRYTIYGLTLNKNGEGEYNYWVLNF
jgi:hypothetical protein